MAFYLIGLGLDKKSISLEAKAALLCCEIAYLESYTVDFPYTLEDLEDSLQTKLTILKREQTEDESILAESKKRNVALLVYGDPFSATTHSQLIHSCKNQDIPYKIFHNASIINAVGETGLSLYKFGKISSMPTWTEKYKPASFIDYILENQGIKAHSLLLIDIALDFSKALDQFEQASKEKGLVLQKVLVVSSIGTSSQKIVYGDLKDLRNNSINSPFCFIIPSKLHFSEEEFLEKTNPL